MWNDKSWSEAFIGTSNEKPQQYSSPSPKKWQKIIQQTEKIVSQANKTLSAASLKCPNVSPNLQDVYTEGTQLSVWGTCLAFYNTAPTLWNSPSGRAEIHCDLKLAKCNESKRKCCSSEETAMLKVNLTGVLLALRLPCLVRGSPTSSHERLRTTNTQTQTQHQHCKHSTGTHR